MSNIKSVRKVPKIFIEYGDEFTQLKREGDIAIYRRKPLPQKKMDLIGYEVVKINKHNGGTMNGLAFEPAEVYPSDSQWGIYGFTCTSLEAAEKRFQKLKEEHKC